MTNERWRRVDELFHSALGREGAERASFLREACAGDEMLRGEVERLIAAHEQEGSFIDSPAYADTRLLIEDPAVLTAGQPLGPYKIITPFCICIGTVNKPNLLHARLLDGLTPEDRLGS